MKSNGVGYDSNIKNNAGVGGTDEVLVGGTRVRTYTSAQDFAAAMKQSGVGEVFSKTIVSEPRRYQASFVHDGVVHRYQLSYVTRDDGIAMQKPIVELIKNGTVADLDGLIAVSPNTGEVYRFLIPDFAQSAAGSTKAWLNRVQETPGGAITGSQGLAGHCVYDLQQGSDHWTLLAHPALDSLTPRVIRSALKGKLGPVGEDLESVTGSGPLEIFDGVVKKAIEEKARQQYGVDVMFFPGRQV